MKFESLNLNPDILKGINDAGFEHCTSIQEQSLPECLMGKDLIAQSQTGTGKTAVFLITIFTKALTSGPNTAGRPMALVMVPTRELATQVIDDAMKLGKHLSFRSVAVYGGVEYGKQINALKTGVELVVATPGRMIDLYKSRALSLENIGIFVVDEADRMFDMGFAPDIMYIAGRLPKQKPRQTMLFSATIDANVRRLAARYMLPDPVMIEIEPEQVTVNAIDQKIIYVSNEEKLSVLLTLLKRPEVLRSIIFTNMKITAEKLGWKLAANGLPASVLTGDMTQERRHKVIEGMKSGRIKMLIATDVAARGLHIDDITHIFNYDLPDDAASYVHRVGRTARAGKSGKAYSLVCEDHVLNLPEIEKYTERKFESEWIEDSELVKDIAPKYRERQGRGKPFEKKVTRPGAAHKAQSFPSREGKGRPHTWKKTAPSVGEKPAGRPGNKPQHPQHPKPHENRPPHAHAKKEIMPVRQTDRPNRPQRPAVEHRPRLAERPLPPPVKAEDKAHAPASEKHETPPKEAKPWILKRLIKFLKKS
ncbi:MAG: DEAD/DEAH box helicase [Deltaproteobacteria bacterium]|nr:DEAD/DEAH box helicase [Deltaproteobacteria bacterium]